MSDAPDRDSQTEAATPRRLQQAREQGQVAISRECVTLAALGAAALALALLAPAAGSELAKVLAGLLDRAHEDDLGAQIPILLRAAAGAALVGAGPFVVAILLAGAGAVLAQTGLLLNATPLHPKLSRLNPWTGLKRLIGLEGLVETLKSVLKLATMAGALWLALGGQQQLLAGALAWSPALLLDRILRLTLRVLLAVLAAQAVIALADLAWVRLRHARSLRMSREELRQDTKEAEGDPRIKARIRQIRQLRARRRMMLAVPNATVVITNPTHYAVALAYDRARNAAPRVVAKGVDVMAARIRELAAQHRVPMVANPPLARALYRVELDTDIPETHFKAVAEIIAYVWGLDRRARR